MRLLIFFILLSVTILFGYYSYIFFYDLETKTENTQYDSFVDEIELSILSSIEDKISGLILISSLLGHTCNTVEMWPNCTLPIEQFSDIADPIISLANIRTISFAPLLKENDVTGFEKYIYDFFQEQNYSDLGVNDFGKGIFSVNENGTRYHDVTGSDIGMDNNLLVPVTQIGDLPNNNKAIMLNLYSEINRINAIDYSINCSYYNDYNDCIALTKVIHLVQDPIFEPASLSIHPIYTKGDNKLVAITTSVYNWNEVLSTNLPTLISGIDIIMKSGDEEYTYRYTGGKAKYLDTGDNHDSRYSNSKHEIHINNINGYVHYEFSLYKTKEFENLYHTNGPIYASVASMSIVIFISISFLIYDKYVNNEILKKELMAETKNTFVKFISHEIRTPLNTVSLCIHSIHSELYGQIYNKIDNNTEESIILMKEWLEILEDIEGSSNEAILVLNDLINYDKLSIGALTLDLSLINIKKFIIKTVKPLKIQANLKNISIIMDEKISNRVYLENKYVYGDTIKLTQVIRNILSNAIKFTPVDGNITININHEDVLHEYIFDNTIYKCGGIITITVIDTGAGISIENQKKLFGQGIQFNVNNLQAGQGSGLGLWITKGIVELHYGKIYAQSNGEGCGTTFVLEIPMIELLDCESSNPSTPDIENNIEMIDTLSDVNTLVSNILIVDDSNMNRKIISKLLTKENFKCYQCEDGDECIKFMNSMLGKDIDLILLDYEMPNRNGPDTAKYLRDNGYMLPIVGLTGNVLQSDTDYFLNHGATKVIHKPISIDVLKETIKNVNKN